MPGIGPLRKKSVLRRDMGEETVLYDEQTGAVHALNPTASLVWDLCDGKHSVGAMEESLRDRFNVGGGEAVAEDIRKVIERFQSEGLLEEP